jgi:3-methyladenine DNA glycosylase AlkD
MTPKGRAEPSRRDPAHGRSAEVADILAWLERRGSGGNVEGMARYGIRSPKLFGVSVAELRRKAKELGRNHELALALWETGWYEARMLASFIADPNAITARDMDGWVREFDNWAITDTVCFSLFDQSPRAWAKVDQWAGRNAEFVRRAGFALLASLALHDKHSPDVKFKERLALIRRHASDDRNFVKKGMSWALHGIGCRSPGLHIVALKLAADLAKSDNAAERWLGKDALRKLTSPATNKRLHSKTATQARNRRESSGSAP